MKKRLLLFLMLTVILLSASTVLITTYAFKAQEWAMDSMMRSYVLDLAENFTDRAVNGMGGGMGRGHGRGAMMHFRMLSAAPSLQNEEAGGVLVLTQDKAILAGSPGAEKLLALWEGELRQEEPTEVRDAADRRYYIAVRQLQAGVFVLAAVSKTHLLAPVIRVRNFWMPSAMATSVAVLAGMLALWKYLVVPLRKIVESIGHMKWGRERPQMPLQRGFFEVSALSDVIQKLAKEAVAKEELKIRYVSDLVRIQEDAKKRLSRELHDGPLQGVVAAIKRIQLAEDRISGDTAAQEHLNTAENICQHAANEIRNYCDELSPSWVKLGLVSAMCENADRLSRAYGVTVDAEVSDALDSISEEHVLALVRILQEAVSNSVRHGEASQIALDAKKEKGCVLFSIRDDGKGFCAKAGAETDYEKLRTTGHRGLANINERVQLLRGTMRIESEPGQGCRISVSFPLPE